MLFNLKGEFKNVYGDPVIDGDAANREVDREFRRRTEAGEAIKREDVTKPKPALTLKTVIINALYGNYPDEKTLSGKDKLYRHVLARKVLEADESLDVDIEDLSLIKELIAKGFSTLISGQAWEMIEAQAGDKSSD